MEILALPGIIAVHGTIVDNRIHRHHALQIVLGGQSPVELKAADSSLFYRALAIAPDLDHRLEAEMGWLFLIEPESSLSIDLCQRWFSKHKTADLGTILPNELIEFFHDRPLSREAVLTFLSRLSPSLGFEPSLKPSIRQVLQWIDATVAAGDWEGVSLAQALEIACLSESRFLHLFTEQLGIPWRRYLLWRRLLGGIFHAAAGHSLTESAHHAAFSDAAHFSRTFTSMFGLSPALVLKNSRFIQD